MNFEQLLATNERTGLTLSHGLRHLMNGQDFEKRKLSLSHEISMLPEEVPRAHAENFNDEWLASLLSDDELFFHKVSYNDFFRITLEKFIQINSDYDLFNSEIKSVNDFFESDEYQELAFGLCQVNLLILSQAIENNSSLQKLFGLKKSMLGKWKNI
tara:strand:- start:73 stop:543 length:471 start_codon:yes stop_codon:yes gene_type:complete